MATTGVAVDQAILNRHAPVSKYAVINSNNDARILSLDAEYPEDNRLETLQDASLRSGLSPRFIASILTNPIHSIILDGNRYYRRVYVDILNLKLTEESDY